MAYYSIFPEKDTTIYSHPDRIHMNTGKDEILELVEEKATTGNTYYPSRILIKFKTSDIVDILTNKKGYVNTENYKANLQLFSAEHKHLTQDHVVEIRPLSQSWDEGTTRYDGNPSLTTTGANQAANGATWVYRTNSTASA